MSRFQITRFIAVLAMLLSIAGGQFVEASSTCAGTGKVCVKCCCCQGMACCGAAEKQPPQKRPAPVQQRVGQELAAAVLDTPFSVLFTIAPAEARRAPRALFADRHSPAPLAAGCIRLI
jgi:hypothetical protein